MADFVHTHTVSLITRGESGDKETGTVELTLKHGALWPRNAPGFHAIAPEPDEFKKLEDDGFFERSMGGPLFARVSVAA